MLLPLMSNFPHSSSWLSLLNNSLLLQEQAQTSLRQIIHCIDFFIAFQWCSLNNTPLFSTRKVVDTGEIPSQKAADQTTEAAAGYKTPLKQERPTDCRYTCRTRLVKKLWFQLKAGCQICSCQWNRYGFDFQKHMLDLQRMRTLNHRLKQQNTKNWDLERGKCKHNDARYQTLNQPTAT